MNFTKITINTGSRCDDESVELLIARLSDLGAEGCEIGGGEELRLLLESTPADLIDGDSPLYAQADSPMTVTVYIPQNTQGAKIRADIEEYLHSAGLEYAEGEVREEDWANNWKAYFKPLPIGRRLVVKPTWCDYANTEGRLVLEIDPASAFGTGQHATTRLCLELLEGISEERTGQTRVHHVLDIGCGSGILSAAAALLCGESTAVTAVDICENAVSITRETLRANSPNSSSFRVFCGNIITDEGLRGEIGTLDGGYDVVVANITADVIIAMSELLPQFAGRTLILSGIIAPRLPEVLAAISPHFSVAETRESEGWVALVAETLSPRPC